MPKPFLVAEDLTPRWNLFRLLGTPWEATRYGWLSMVWWIALGCAVALADRRRGNESAWFIQGLAYGAVLMLSNFVHSVGHVVVGRSLGSAVRTVLVTSTRDVILYERPGTAESSRCRLGRSLGGPAANLAVGCVLLLAGGLVVAPWIRMAGVINVAVGFWALMPVPSLDGWVIWSSLRRPRCERT